MLADFDDSSSAKRQEPRHIHTTTMNLIEPIDSTSTPIPRGTGVKASSANSKNWYALRVFGNKTLWFRTVIDQKAAQGLETETGGLSGGSLPKQYVSDGLMENNSYRKSYGVETYIAMEASEKVVRQSKPCNKMAGGKSSRQVKTVTLRKPLVSSLMFIRCSEKFLKELKSDYLSDFTYYTRYADCPDLVSGKTSDPSTPYAGTSGEYKLRKVPAVIPDDQMQTFIWLTSENFKVRYLGEPKDLKLGDRVRIISGPLEGRTGNIKRIKKDRKFVITIGSVAAFTIEGITHDMMEKVDDK